MVSFQCDACADTVKKPQLDKHRQKCWGTFTCLDCSTTFRNQDYKSHTTCVSEAEKYQGALFKGPKKAKQQLKPAEIKVTPGLEAPSPAVQASTSSPAASGIHPSRLHVFEADENASASAYHAGPSNAYRDNRNNSRGRGAFGPPGRVSSGAQRPSGQNSLRPKDGMRSWGSPATTDMTADEVPSQMVTPIGTPPPAAAAAAAEDKQKKKRRKGDKGGTGVKANSKNPRSESAPVSEAASISILPKTAEPASKKRKFEADPVSGGAGQLATDSTTVAPASTGDKTAKRIRKNLKKLSESGDWNDASLASWLERLGKSKGQAVDVGEILGSLIVSLKDGKWTVSAP